MKDCRTAALVVTADNEYKEKDFHVPRCVKELESLNLAVDMKNNIMLMLYVSMMVKVCSLTKKFLFAKCNLLQQS